MLVALPKLHINRSQPVLQSWQQALRAHCSNIYTVKLGLEYVDLWLMHWPGPGRHLNYPPVKMGMERPKVSTKGQIISKCRLGVFKLTKKPTQFL